MAEILPLRNAVSPLLLGRQVEEATGWPVRFADMIRETPTNGRKLETLSDLDRRTAVVHGRERAKVEEGRGSLALPK